MDGNQFEMGYEVEKIMGSQYTRLQKGVLFQVKWKGYSNTADWTEKPYKDVEDKRLLKECLKLNPQAMKDNRMRRLS
jgi:hypothetical protein